jgi:anaerobic selenocysteine-containing dehydrogenase
LALAVAHVLIREDLLDRDFIARGTVGFDAYREEASKFPPERAAEICGVPVETIRELARSYGAARAPFLRIGNGLQRHTNGGQAVRAIICLPALVGAFNRPGGGALWETFDAFPMNWTAFEGEGLQRHPTRAVNMVQLGHALTALAAPPVRALFVYQSNPAAVCPEQAQVVAGLAREDLFTVVHEQMHTDTVDYADLVLPATNSFESLDLYRSYGHYYLQLARPVIPPQGEARSNWDLFRALATRMDFADPIFSRSTEEVIRGLLDVAALGAAGITYDRLVTGEPLRVRVPRTGNPFVNGCPTPSGKIEFVSGRLAAQGLPAVPTYLPAVEGHEARTPEAPLQFMAPPAKDFLNTSFGCVDRMRHGEGKPRVKIHPADAAARGIAADTLVRVFNRRGACLLFAEVTEDVSPGLLVAEGIWWSKHHPGGRGVNQLASQRVTDLGGCSTLHENLVDVETAHA